MHIAQYGEYGCIIQVQHLFLNYTTLLIAYIIHYTYIYIGQALSTVHRVSMYKDVTHGIGTRNWAAGFSSINERIG